ncbi:MAG: DUF4070 domain-containing protein [Candidatus Omnitrophica bacterium]|nr:DUF4070 domain-containing protein [Candidatus Omnitrophota bacterium]
MNILWVYPKYPDTFWSFKHVMRFISKKAAFPPLGVVTVAAMLPRTWKQRLIDMNAERLRDRDIEWADYVFVSAMVVQKEGTREVIRRCKGKGVKVVGGGPLFSIAKDDFPELDHVVLDEAESIIGEFVRDLEGGQLKKVYQAGDFPSIEHIPQPRWDLLNFKHYVSMAVQFSRGCPFDCEFCDIVVLNGRVPRCKTTKQFMGELESLHKAGWRGSVFIVDDNFIGNKVKIKALLPALERWMCKKKRPFAFLTEASINLSEDKEMLDMMARCGFEKVFVGIETPHEKSLEECRKFQNKRIDMIKAVRNIQAAGIEVMAGFIIGFDSDPVSIFEKQIQFIQRSGIATAMVGLLVAIPNTKLYHRLVKEGRILEESSGDNTDGSLNFQPILKRETLLEGYRRVIKTIYAPNNYYKRVWMFLRQCKRRRSMRLTNVHIIGFFNSLWLLGIVDKDRAHYWKLFIGSLIRHPLSFGHAISLSMYGYHFRKMLKSLAF